MLLFRSTTTKTLRCSRLLIPLQWHRLSSSYEAHFEAVNSVPNLESLTWESVGLRQSVIKAAQTAFPNIVHPTETQTRLIPGILAHKDVLLADQTGSGKSMGIVLALLNKPRMRFKDTTTGEPRDKLSITSLLLVPHRDLANQLYLWVRNMAEVSSPQRANMDPIAQVLVRDGDKHTTTGINKLKADPPHILIATPQAVIDVIDQDPTAIPLSEISTVVLDEIDYLVETVPRNNDPKRNRYYLQKLATRLKKHPGAATELLNSIYESRILLLRDGPQEEIANAPTQVPQLVVSSATLRKTLHQHIFVATGWVNPDNTLFVRGQQFTKTEARSRGLGGGGIQHSVVLVKAGEAKNIDEAVAAPENAVDFSEQKGELVEVDASEEQKKKYGAVSSPFDQEVFEAIATAFAVDVPSVALLVLKSDAPIHRAVYDLRLLGVNAVALDVSERDKGGAHLLNRGDTTQFKANPTLLVCTRATFRGLDLPELTHVFVVGIFDSKMTSRFVDEYLQIAGRVGRFGRGGKVITFINDNGEGEKPGQLPSNTQIPRLLAAFTNIGVEPVKYEVFE